MIKIYQTVGGSPFWKQNQYCYCIETFSRRSRMVNNVIVKNIAVYDEDFYILKLKWS